MLTNIGLADLNPRVCGMEQCEPNHSFGPARRAYYLLHYVAKGFGVLHNERGEHRVLPGQIFVIRPDENTVYTADEENPWLYYWIGFDSSLPLPLATDVLDAAPCEPLFVSMAGCEIADRREWFITGKLYELLARLASPPSPFSRTARYVQMACNYIEANYQRELRVQGIAANLGLDRSYFSQIFRRACGKSPQQYIVDLRLTKAAELIAAHGLSAGEAASQVGYADAFTFSRMFSSRYGVPPSRYAGLKRPEGRGTR